MEAAGGSGRRAGVSVLFSIREFRFAEDYSAVIQLWSQAGPGIQVRRSDTPEEIAKKVMRDPDLFLLAEEEEGILVGAVMGGFDGRRGMVYHLAVDHRHRRQGVGAALMLELERRLKEKGCIKYYLLVTRDNEQAMRFYEDLGWERMDLHVYGKEIP
jgi:ribosomal protein S18 acetylase RimI-like enzyme